LKRFDSEYMTFHTTEETSNVEITLDMYKAVQPLIKKGVDALLEKINTVEPPVVE